MQLRACRLLAKEPTRSGENRRLFARGCVRWAKKVRGHVALRASGCDSIALNNALEVGTLWARERQPESLGKENSLHTALLALAALKASRLVYYRGVPRARHTFETQSLTV